MLRYEAVLEPGTGRKLINIDHERRFVVSFFMAGESLFMAAVLVACCRARSVSLLLGHSWGWAQNYPLPWRQARHSS